MANTLTLKLEEFSKALATLKEALNQEENGFIRDSVVKRFEYTFELCWKTVKIFLSEKYGVDVFSPKECFRELRKNSSLSDDEIVHLLAMTDDCNEIIHTYQESFANELYEKIKDRYYNLLGKVYEVVK